MALESHAKFEKKLALGFENDLNDLVNFNASCEKSENLHFDVVFFQQQLQFQLKNSEVLSLMPLKSDPVFEENLTFCLKNDMRILTRAVKNPKICTLMEYFCQKHVMFELK